MSPADPVYRKLPGDFRGFFRRYTLWLGADHILQVDSSRFSETYKRFYLRDIQTVIIRKAPRFVLPVYSALLAVVALILLLVGSTPFRPLFFWPAIAILATLSAYLYVASMFQSCACHLITRVNQVELPSLYRLPAARRFVEVLAPRIVAAQGELPSDWLERSTTVEELSPAAARDQHAPIGPLPAGEFNPLAVVAFLLILADSVLTWLRLRANDSNALSMLSTVNMIALAVCATAVIVRLSRQKGGRALRMLILAGLSVVAAATYGSVLLQSLDEQFYHQRYKNTMQYTGMRSLDLIEMIAAAAVGLPGLFLAIRRKSGGLRP